MLHLSCRTPCEAMPSPLSPSKIPLFDIPSVSAAAALALLAGSGSGSGSGSAAAAESIALAPLFQAFEQETTNPLLARKLLLQGIQNFLHTDQYIAICKHYLDHKRLRKVLVESLVDFGRPGTASHFGLDAGAQLLELLDC